MTFIHHNYLGDLELQKKETNGIRLYNLPDGQWVPSITSVTSFYNRQIFADWRKRVGVEEANKITKKATARGTDYHEAAQNYLLNLELNWDDYQPMTKFMFYNTLPYLDKINNIHAIERTLYSEYLGLAGRVDCIAEYEGELAVIDFKSSKKPKPREWIDHYFVQCAAYACMLFEMTEIPVKKFVIIMSCENGECIVYEEYDKKKYINLLSKYIRDFVEYKLQEYA